MLESLASGFVLETRQALQFDIGFVSLKRSGSVGEHVKRYSLTSASFC